jgi:hypothetical protein
MMADNEFAALRLELEYQEHLAHEVFEAEVLTSTMRRLLDAADERARLREAVSKLSEVDLCRHGSSPCAWSLELIARAERLAAALQAIAVFAQAPEWARKVAEAALAPSEQKA